MRKKTAVKRFAAAATAVIISFGMLTNSGTLPVKETVVQAESTEMQENKKNISNAESKLKELEKKQKKLDQKIKSTSGDIKAEKENQEAISEQIDTVQSTILQLSNSIAETSKKISALEKSIKETQLQVDEKKSEIYKGVGDFKERVRLMYINGTGSYSDILIGATDFYDMLMKFELVKKVAAHDNQMIDNLISLKNQYEKEKEKLESSRKELETSKANLEEKKKKQQEQKKKLDGLFAESKEAQKQLEIDKAAYEKNKSKVKEESDEFEEKIQKLYKQQQAIKKKEAEEAERRRKAAEAAERKRQAEEAAKQAAAAAAAAQQQQQQQQQQNNTSSNSGGSGNTGGNSGSTSNSGSSSGSQSSASNSDYGHSDKSQFTWPVPGFYHITYGVGWRWGAYHKGIDISSSGIRGAAIVASASGTVIQVNNVCPHDYGKSGSCGCGGGYGKYCIIDHGNGYWTLYGHSQNIIVTQGQHVEQGQVIGYVGSTGFSTGDHLHFEVRLNGEAQDPTNYV